MRREILVGDALECLKGLEPDSVDCIVTSPPYWGLRDYGVEGQLGLEPTWRQHLERLLPIFAECKRVLKPSGNLWVNYGDTVVTGGGKANNPGGDAAKRGRERVQPPSAPNRFTAGNGPTKHKIGLAWRLRFALNDELGLISRSDVVWHKPNMMPLSVKDRLTPKYEMVFHFVKNPRYAFDLDAIRRPFASDREDSTWEARRARGGKKGVPPGQKPQSTQRPMGGSNVAGFNIRVRDAQKGRIQEKSGSLATATPREVEGYVEHPLKARRDKTLEPSELGPARAGSLRPAPEPGEEGAFHPLGANPGDVWTIPNEPLKEAHFATFPSELASRCLKAGCPERVCATCGKPWTRRYVSEMVWQRGAYRGINSPKEQLAELAGSHTSRGDGMVGTGVAVHHAAGWSPPCDHGGFAPGLALDPFAGSGTVGVAAAALGLQFVLVELKPEYAEIARKRLGAALNPLETFGGV